VVNARLVDGRVVDLLLEGGTVADILPAGSLSVTGASDELDVNGFVLMTAPADPHAHLDKALSFDAISPPMGDLGRAVESWVEFTQGVREDDVYRRARTQALHMLANGTTAVRSHVDLVRHGDDALICVRALLRVREELRDLMDIQLVALGGEFVDDAAYEAAIAAGVDLVGGAPHMAADPIGELQRQLALAERLGKPVDLHTDESLDGPLTIVEMARLVRDRAARGWDVPVSAGHCVRLGTLPLDELAEVIAEVKMSDLGIITLPITNLYLQGWEQPVATPRGLTAIAALLDAGVRVGAGAENVRDPFNPVGRSDALETASLLVTAGHLTFNQASDLIGNGARDVMDLPLAGPTVGARAELLAVRGDSLGDVIASASAERYVIHNGALVSHTTVTRHIAAPI
jgi:cytosine/creatinine deaminase